MNNSIHKIGSIFLFLLLAIGLQAQLTDKVIEEVNGKRYYVHTVEKGHSLYAIAKLYQSDVEIILENNPSAADGVKIGQALRIPVDASSSEGEMWTNPIRIEDGQLIHRVKRKETLYSISKQYNADMNDILEQNPVANSGLKRGMELLIPLNDIEASFLPERAQESKTNQRQHLVEAKETIYSISRKYGVDIDALIQANGGFPEGLKAGSEISIPVVPEENKVQRAGIDTPVPASRDFKLDIKDEIIYKNQYRIALLLPFYSESGTSSKSSTSKMRLRQIAVEFYRGMLTGLDSARQQGLSVELIVRDVHAGTENLNGLLADLQAEGVDLVVGPLQRDPFEKVAKFFNGTSTHVVCPVKQNNKVLLYSDNLSKVVPSNVSQMDAMAGFIVNKYPKANVIFVKSDFAQDIRYAQLFENAFNSYTSQSDSTSLLNVVGVNKNKTLDGFENALAFGKKNIIVAPTSNEVVVADLMRRLMQLDDDKFDIELYGLDSWRGYYETVPMEAREEYAVHMPSDVFLSVDDEKSQRFAKIYKDEYNADPGKYAYLSYDIARFYGLGLLRFGKNFPNRFEEIDQTYLLQTHFDFAKTGMNAGYENRHVFLLTYEEYKLEKAQ